MLASLFAGTTGLRNHAVRMDVIGNNIANINSTGFKKSRATFQEFLVEDIRGAGRASAITGGTNPIQKGLGVTVASIDNIFSQGGLELTGQTTDLAIQGRGFFVLSDNNQNFFTRAGTFGFDGNSDMVSTANGLYVMGKMANISGEIDAMTPISKIHLPFGQQDPARGTTEIELVNNLNSTATESIATLVSSGTTNINTVTGQAVNGAGGTHTLTVSGSQATNSTAVSDVTGLTGTETLGSLGLTTAGLSEATSLSIDSGSNLFYLSQYTTTTTVNELVQDLNDIDGVDAYINGSGEIEVKRTYAGAGTGRNITIHSTNTDDGDGTAAAANETLTSLIFIDNSGATSNATFNINNGTAHSMVVTDTFVPNDGSAPAPQNLEVEVNSETGIVDGIKGLGGGGVTIKTESTGLAAGSAMITTADTEYSTSLTIYDSQGGKHTLVLTFTKLVSSNEWVWEASLGAEEQILYGGSGRVKFQNDGSLSDFLYDGSADRIGIDPKNGADVMEIDVNAGTPGDFDGLTGFSATSTASISNQDGYGLGVLDSIAIDPTGKILGIFTNGVTRTLAQVLVATFKNDQGLSKSGTSIYKDTANTGEPFYGFAGETISSTISSGALEASNVDLAEEFTTMIITQRGFQANARVITTSDSMLDELVNLKR